MAEEEELSQLNSVGKNQVVKEENKDRVEFQKITHLKYRLLKTFLLFLSWIALGLFSEILGPALPALRVLSNTNHEEVSRALSSRAIGLLIGSLVGGLLADQFLNHRNVLIFIFLSLAGITVGTIPLCRSLSILAFNLFISGFSHGAFTTSGNPSLGDLWKEKSTGPYNFMHSGYGLGAAVAPLLIKAFDRSNESTSLNVTLTEDSAIFIQSSFLIVTFYCIAIGSCFLLLFFTKDPTRQSKTSFNTKSSIVSESVDQANQFKFSKWKRRILEKMHHVDKRTIVVMILCFISYFALVGNERVFGKFQFSYAIEGSLKMTKSEGYLINCLYWVAFCIARIFIALVALKVPAKILLMTEISGALVSSVVFTIWNQSKMVFFIFSTSFGFFKSPLFPTMLGVLSLYITVSGILVVVVNFGSAAGAAACQYLAGYLIHKYGHYTFPLTVTGTAAFLLTVFILVILVTRTWKKNSDN